METIHELSRATPLTELDLFSVPPTQASIDSDVYSEHRPISVLDPGSAITFVIPTPVDEYMQLREMMFYIKVRINIAKTTTTELVEADWKKISFVNYLMHALFKQVEVEINNKSITSGSPTYSYKAYLDALLHFSDDARYSHLTGALLNSNSWNNDDQEGLNADRQAIMKPTTFTKDGKGRMFDMMGKLHVDIAYQEKALLGGSQLKITMIPNDPAFYLVLEAASNLRVSVEFITASLFLHRSKVSQPIVDAHSRALNSATAKYPYTRRDVKAYNASKGATSVHLDNVILGVLPRRVFIALVENKAFTGDNSHNPFNFKHFNINYLSVNVDGRQVPSTPYTPDFANKLCVREYMGFLEALNQLDANTLVGTTREGWLKTPIFGFNLAPDMSDGVQASGHVNKIKRGSLRVELRFAAVLPSTVTILIYCEWDSLLQIDKNRATFLDFQ